MRRLVLPATTCIAALLAAAACAPAAAARAGFVERDDVRHFVAETAREHRLDAAWVERQLREARHAAAVTRLIMPPPPGVARDWGAYRDRFVEPMRIAAGVAFWREHAATLARAEHDYGVPATVVAGIVGVETFYGRVTGNFRALDALATLAFDFPAGRSDRSAYFRDELAQLLAWVAAEGVAAASVRSSYAGAIGLPQFMPSSLRRFAVDYDGDGRVDLRGSAVDAIGSVANFLAAHGWQRGVPTHFAVTPPAARSDRALLLAPDIVPTFTAAQMRERGATLDDAAMAHDGPLALVEVHNGPRAPSHVAGTHNFFVLTRYNRSSYYALAVIELGAAVRAAFEADRAAAR